MRSGKSRSDHIKGQRKQMAGNAGKPPGHDRRMGSRQILDTYGKKARVRPRHHQPVPSQYKDGEVGGSEIQKAWFGGRERGKIYFEGSDSGSFGEVSCWDDLLPKRGKLS